MHRWLVSIERRRHQVVMEREETYGGGDGGRRRRHPGPRSGSRLGLEAGGLDQDRDSRLPEGLPLGNEEVPADFRLKF